MQLLSNTLPQLAGIPFLFVSSQLAISCNTIYGTMKRLGEHWTQLNGGTIVRLWNAYGSIEPVSDKSHVMSDIIHQALTRREIHLMTNGLERRQFVHVDDICRAFRMAFDVKCGIYSAANHSWVSILEIANKIGDITKSRVFIGDRVADQKLEIESDYNVPGWRPTISLDDGLSMMLRDYSTNFL